MHFAKFEKSPRLQRVAAYLSDGQWRSTMNIIHGANVCAVNSCIAELRANGFVILSRPMARTFADGKGAWEYRLYRFADGASAPDPDYCAECQRSPCECSDFDVSPDLGAQ